MNINYYEYLPLYVAEVLAEDCAVVY